MTSSKQKTFKLRRNQYPIDCKDNDATQISSNERSLDSGCTKKKFVSAVSSVILSTLERKPWDETV